MPTSRRARRGSSARSMRTSGKTCGRRPPRDDRQRGGGEARLELYTRLQTQEVARDQAAWQETIYQNTLELIKALQKGESPEEIHRRFADRAVGENRVKLITAYAQYRLAIATIERNRELFAQNLITPKQFQQVNADFEVAQATYQSLMDQMGYEARLANTRARQARHQAEAEVRVAQEQLRILSVKRMEPYRRWPMARSLASGPTGRCPPGAAEAAAQKPETILPPAEAKGKLAVKPVGAQPDSGPRTCRRPPSAPIRSGRHSTAPSSTAR